MELFYLNQLNVRLSNLDPPKQKPYLISFQVKIEHAMRTKGLQLTRGPMLDLKMQE